MQLSYSLERDEYADGLKALIAQHPVERQGERYKNYVVVGYYIALTVTVFGLIRAFPQATLGILILALVTVLLQSVSKTLIDRLTAMDMGAGYDSRRHSDITAVFDDAAITYIG